jgi:hypothetical protein
MTQAILVVMTIMIAVCSTNFVCEMDEWVQIEKDIDMQAITKNRPVKFNSWVIKMQSLLDENMSYALNSATYSRSSLLRSSNVLYVVRTFDGVFLFANPILLQNTVGDLKYGAKKLIETVVQKALYPAQKSSDFGWS